MGLFSRREDQTDTQVNTNADYDLISKAIDTLEPTLETMSKADEDKFIADLAALDGAVLYFSSLMAADVKRFWKATSPADQLSIRGSFARTLYIKSRILKEKAKKEATKETPKLGKRYAR